MISPLICRSREGAWIEIHLCGMLSVDCMGRSREGAWIEMCRHRLFLVCIRRRSREGAWIEMMEGWAQGES